VKNCTLIIYLDVAILALMSDNTSTPTRADNRVLTMRDFLTITAGLLLTVVFYNLIAYRVF